MFIHPNKMKRCFFLSSSVTAWLTRSSFLKKMFKAKFKKSMNANSGQKEKYASSFHETSIHTHLPTHPPETFRKKKLSCKNKKKRNVLFIKPMKTKPWTFFSSPKNHVPAKNIKQVVSAGSTFQSSKIEKRKHDFFSS